MENQPNQERVIEELGQDDSGHENQTPFDNLEFVRDLNEGIHGLVSLYRDPRDQRLIAVKKYNLPESPDTTNAFHREVLALKRLKHPCVLPIIYYIDPQPATSTTIATPPRIGTQYAPNGSLRDVLNKIESNDSPPFVNDTWLALTVTGIVIGMKYIHSIGWIHRDLKPENILIDENGHPLIGDLGSSRLVDLNVTMTRNIGSPRYMAPEMYEEGRYNNAIDVYSFSLMLYEMVTKQPVFPRNIQPAPLMRRVLDGTRADIPESVCPEVREIISRCWSVDPGQRLSFAQIYDILSGINFKITPNVDEQVVKAYVEQIDPTVDINVRLWNGEMYPMQVKFYEPIYDIRKRIGEHLHVPIEQIIPSRNGKPLCCCWHHTMDNSTTFNEIINPVQTIELCIDILYPIAVKFRIVPRTVNDLLNDLKDYETHHGCDGCKLKYKFRRVEITPSDESIIDKGITFNSQIISHRLFNDKVKIDQNEIECNLDDPVDDLILRYVIQQRMNIDKFIYLEKDGRRLNEDRSLRDNGVVSNDNLTIKSIESDHECKVVYNGNSAKLHLPPDESIRSLIRNTSYAVKIRIPLRNVDIFHSGYLISSDSDQTISEAQLLDLSAIHIRQKYFKEIF